MTPCLVRVCATAGPAVVFSFALAGIVAALDALCYAELSSRYPLAGSVFLYTHLAFGELPALLVGCNLLLGEGPGLGSKLTSPRGTPAHLP